MDKRAGGTAVDRVDIKCRARHGGSDAQAASEALDEGSFAHPKITVKGQRAGGRQHGGELGRDSLGFAGGGGDKA